MSYQEVFEQFLSQVKESTESGQFAKLTMAKTIGKLDLKNIFVRPIESKGEFKVLLKLRFRSRETEDKENELTIDEAFNILKNHLRNPFTSVILFTTTKDVTYKMNKKGAASISEQAPTFKEIVFAEKDVE